MRSDVRTAVAPGRKAGCYRDQSQKPLNEEEASRALARPAGLRASFTAAARRANHPAARHARRNRFLDVVAPRAGSANRLLLLLRRRRIGDGPLARRTPAFSGAAAGTSLPAGTASGLAATEAGLPAAARPLRALRCGPTEVARSPDYRLLSGSAPSVAWERWRSRRDGRRGCLARSLGGHFGGRLRPRGCAGVTLGAGRARIRARAAAGFTASWDAAACGASAISVAARSEWRRATTPDTQSAPAMPPNNREHRRNAQLAA